MELTGALSIRQRPLQQLKLSARMRQALELLQLPCADLKAYLEEQIEGNPLLDRRMEERSLHSGGKSPDPEIPSLVRHLLSQWNSLTLPAGLLSMGRRIIEVLDGNGYLDSSLEEIAQECGADVREVERALEKVQALDPAGVGCRSLAECLLLQLARFKDRTAPALLAERLVRDHLKDLPSKSSKSLAENLNAPEPDIRAALQRIRKLNPKPGSAFGPMTSIGVVPDVTIRRKRGGYEALCSRGDLPEIRIQPSYKKLLDDPRTPEETRAYLRQKLRAAVALLGSLEKRERTLTKLARLLAEEQAAFLSKGAAFWKPLGMEQMARRLGVHKSTVSRAVCGKFADTPQGMVALKSFFSNALGGKDRPQASMAVQHKIRTLVRGESPVRPLSDARIASILRGQGITVARRTVAKYRGKLRIPPSSMRVR